MSVFWILKERVPVPAEAPEWSKWFEVDANRRVMDTTVTISRLSETTETKIRVSTFFFGVDPTRSEPPLLFETVITGGPLHGEKGRWATWTEAEAGHAAAVERVREAGR